MGSSDTSLWLGLRHTNWHFQKDWCRAQARVEEVVKKYQVSLSSHDMEEGQLRDMNAKAEGLQEARILHDQVVDLTVGCTHSIRAVDPEVVGTKYLYGIASDAIILGSTQ